MVKSENGAVSIVGDADIILHEIGSLLYAVKDVFDIEALAKSVISGTLNKKYEEGTISHNNSSFWYDPKELAKQMAEEVKKEREEND